VKTLEHVAAVEKGLKVKLMPDQRWAAPRHQVGGPAAAGPRQARSPKAAGFDEAWMVEDGFITEGASSTAYIVTHDDKIITRGNGNTTLPGARVLRCWSLRANRA
jgi:D-alanine transaminase